MKTVGEVYSFINSFAPFSSQTAWDNSGILLGDESQTAEAVLVCLDLTKEAAIFAAEHGCSLIVSHHPVIFRALKSIPSASVFWPLIQNGISVIGAHTNLDKAPGGVNDTLCSVLGFPFTKCGDETGDGFLNLCCPETPISAHALAALLREKLGGAVRYVDAGRPIRRIAVCAGSGGEFYKEASLLDCDALITGDADHHDLLDAAALGISSIAAGHYETEYPIVPVLAEKLSAHFSELKVLQFPKRNTIITLSE